MTKRPCRLKDGELSHGRSVIIGPCEREVGGSERRCYESGNRRGEGGATVAAEIGAKPLLERGRELGNAAGPRL